MKIIDPFALFRYIYKYPDCLFQQTTLSIIVILSCSSLGFTKPVFLQDEAFNQQSRDQETQIQSDAFQPEENINQESDVTGGLDEILDRPSAHNRTARATNHPCVSHIVRKWDGCRKSYVNIFHCDRTHIFCSQAINVHHSPKCKTVYGSQVKFISKCPLLPVGCQCAA